MAFTSSFYNSRYLFASVWERAWLVLQYLGITMDCYSIGRLAVTINSRIYHFTCGPQNRRGGGWVACDDFSFVDVVATACDIISQGLLFGGKPDVGSSSALRMAGAERWTRASE